MSAIPNAIGATRSYGEDDGGLLYPQSTGEAFAMILLPSMVALGVNMFSTHATALKCDDYPASAASGRPSSA